MVLEFARAEKSDDPFEFRFAPQTYLLRGAGGGYQQATFPWDAALLSDLEAVRDAGGDPEVLARLGELLHRFVTPLGWPQLATQIKQARDQRQRVLLTIRSAAAEIYTLPWELLTLGASGEHVGALPEVLLRYEWPETRTTPEKPLPRTGIGRILLAWSAAGGAVPAAEQIEAVTRACAAGFHPLDPTRDVLAHASLRRLGDTLAAAKREGWPISVLHILCHGAPTRGTFGLVLDGDRESDPAITVDAGRLRQVLAPHADMVRLVVLSACDSGNSGQVGNRLGSIAQALHRAGMAAVVASRYPLSVAGSIRFTQDVYTALLERLASLESAILDARADLAGDAAHRDWASLQLYAREADGPDTRPLQFRPYPGLAAFDRDQRRFYFGREDLTRKLWGRCQDLVGDAQATRLLAILAPSGFGKSSVARAGLLAEIERRPLKFAQTQDRAMPVRIATLKPGAHPLAALQAVLPGDSAGGTASPLVVLADQFEELYTLCTDAAERDAFVDRLLTAATTPEQPTLIVITLRTDFLGEAGRQHPKLYRLFEAQSRIFPPMSADDLRRSIAEPAAQVGRSLDDATVELLLTQVQGNEGALPLLGFALSQIWEGLMAERAPADTLRQIGGVGGALAGKAQEIYGALSEAEKATARRALVRLVRLGDGTRDTRRRMPIRDLRGCDDSEVDVWSVLSKFSTENARLVTLGSKDREIVAEITHEALLEHWTELRQWIEQGRRDRELHDRAMASANLWLQAGRHDGRLWRLLDLDLLAEYRQRNPQDLNPLVMQFLEESLLRQQLAREESENKRQQSLGIYLERGQQLLFYKQKPSEALLWLHRAQEEGSQNPALLDLIKSAMQPVDAIQAVLIGHRDHITSAAFSPDGRRIVTASADHTARIWDAHEGRLLAQLKGHAASVCEASFSPDSRRIVTASEDCTARVWESDKGGLLVELKGHESRVSSATFSPDGRRIVTASADGTARVWESYGGQLLTELKAHEGWVKSAAFSPDGRRIVTTSSSHIACVWGTDGGQLLAKLECQYVVSSAKFSPDGLCIVTADEGETANVWDAEEGRLIVGLTSHYLKIFTAQYSPDGHHIVTASWGGAQVWRADGRFARYDLSNDTYKIHSATWSPDGRHIITMSQEDVAQVWHAGMGIPLFQIAGVRDFNRSVAFSPDGRRVVTRSDNNTAKLWAVDSQRLLTELKGHESSVNHATISPNGRHIVTASDDKTARVWEADSGRQLVELKGHGGAIRRSSYSPDGRYIVTWSEDNTARVWNAQSAALSTELKGSGNGVWDAAFSPDSSRVVSANRDHTASICKADGGQLLAELKGHQDEVYCAAYSPNGRYIVTASEDHTARVWDADRGHLVAELEGHEQSVYRAMFSRSGRHILTVTARNPRVWEVDSGRLVAELEHSRSTARFSPDGHLIVTTNAFRNARVWNTNSGQLVSIIEDEKSNINMARFSPDGRRIVTANEDFTARVWDCQSGWLLAELKGHGDSIYHAEFSPDGLQVVTASRDGTARVWDLSPERRTHEQLSRLINCYVPAKFASKGSNTIVSNMPTAEDFQD